MVQVKGEIAYNGYRLNEFVPQKTSAYISQNDVHVGEMTVKETLDFSARCQGVGTRYGKCEPIKPQLTMSLFIEMNLVNLNLRYYWAYVCTELLSELARREKAARIYPEAELDLFMKVNPIQHK